MSDANKELDQDVTQVTQIYGLLKTRIRDTAERLNQVAEHVEAVSAEIRSTRPPATDVKDTQKIPVFSDIEMLNAFAQKFVDDTEDPK